MAAGVEPWHVIELLILGLAGVLMWNGRQLVRRVDALERDRQTVAQASLDRAEIKSELRDIKDDMKAQNSRIFERLDTIVDRLTFGNNR